MMGTGAFALPAFRKLLESSHEVAGLVTQPDRTGRGHHHHVNPLKELAQAAGVISTEPMSITLRYLQTLTEIASEKNSTIIFPLPIELIHLISGKNQA